MNDLYTVDLILLAAVDRGEIVADANVSGTFAWRDAPVDLDCRLRLLDLLHAGYLYLVDEHADRAPAVLTDEGRKALP